MIDRLFDVRFRGAFGSVHLIRSAVKCCAARDLLTLRFYLLRVSTVRVFDTGGALFLFVDSAQMGSIAVLRAGGGFRRVRAATKGRCPLETCGLERPANFLWLGYCLFAVFLILALSFAILLLPRLYAT